MSETSNIKAFNTIIKILILIAFLHIEIKFIRYNIFMNVMRYFDINLTNYQLEEIFISKIEFSSNNKQIKLDISNFNMKKRFRILLRREIYSLVRLCFLSKSNLSVITFRMSFTSIAITIHDDESSTAIK